MINYLNEIISSTRTLNTAHSPLFYRLSEPLQKENLNKLLKDKPHIKVYDELQSQLEEYVKSANPKTVFKKEQLSIAAKEYLGQRDPVEYGVWVYYPWSERLVHLLDEEEFVLVRTNRNQYKITNEEKELLSKKRIGIIGLSIGQSVAITMAMERNFGELRIADFDILELSNMNRIRTSTHNLCISKAVLVAREIAEIDPFLKVTCFTEGITENNMSDFFLKGGKLDILIEVCDGLDMKIQSRKKARELKVPVLMDTSDRGMIDVERFDLEDNRPILHGLIDHLDSSKLKGLTNEEKIPFILPMIGADVLSPRLKASMMEVEESITTWPQLASSVTLGGALSADICRRILLDQFRSSGRYYIDIEELVKDKEVEKKHLHKEYSEPALSEKEMLSIVSSIASEEEKSETDVPKEKVKQLVELAITAPSGGNSQPWKWLYRKKELILFYDKSRNKSFLDFDDVSAYSSLGAAVENLVLAAHQSEMEVKVKLFPIENNSKVVCSIKFYEKNSKVTGLEPHVLDGLAAMIRQRHTNRNIRPRKQIEQKILTDLISATNTIAGAELRFVDSEKELLALKDIMAAADRIRLLHPQSHYDLYYNEIRWTPEENQKKMDGVDIATIETTASELAGFKLARDADAINYLREWRGGKAFEKMTKKVVESASAIGFITMPKHDKLNYFNGGRAFQRMWLACTEKNIGLQPLLVPLMFFVRLVHGNGAEMPEEMKEELNVLRKRFTNIFPVKENSGEIFLFRICIADTPKVKSLRKPVEEMIHFDL
jgi:tRNA A37 threonylcarbamoyladenosine dehydratase